MSSASIDPAAPRSNTTAGLPGMTTEYVVPPLTGTAPTSQFAGLE